ncbi:MAG TPA: GDP-mannose 4,6-dehydratase, partial [Bacteroidales bacterium]|nr:GDP-mannose 4,6-dehydratase [Bacteroidales bacterium]
MIKPGAHILITGGAGFIGSHLTESLLKHNYKITIIDNLDDFYNPEIKKKNIEAFHKQSNFSFIQDDVRNISTNSNLKLPVDA